METKLGCFEVKVGWGEMDMSGGDNIDGPRWTGKRLQVERGLVIVAPTKELAEAAALSLFFEHEKAKVKTSKRLSDVHAVIRAVREPQ
jgi:hypothetical protein